MLTGGGEWLGDLAAEASPSACGHLRPGADWDSYDDLVRELWPDEILEVIRSVLGNWAHPATWERVEGKPVVANGVSVTLLAAGKGFACQHTEVFTLGHREPLAGTSRGRPLRKGEEHLQMWAQGQPQESPTTPQATIKRETKRLIINHCAAKEVTKQLTLKFSRTANWMSGD